MASTTFAGQACRKVLGEALPVEAASPVLDRHASQQLQHLAATLFLRPTPAGPRVVVFCGVHADNGSSWICATVGQLLAHHAPGQVCLLDADAGSPSLHQYLQASSSSSSSSNSIWDLAVREAVGNPEESNLFWLPPSYLPAASVHSSSLEIQKFVSQLRTQFSSVLIAAPPVGTDIDPLPLFQLADGVVLVLRANVTRRDAARDAAQKLRANGVKVLGTVLSERSFPIPELIYRLL